MDTTVIDYQQIYEKFDLDKTSSEDDMYGLNSTMEPAIKIESCNFGYNGEGSSLPVRILSRVNLKIGHGDFIGIVGGVGSGKESVFSCFGCFFCRIFFPKIFFPKNTQN